MRTFVVDKAPGHVLVCLAGEFDMEVAPQAREVILTAVRNAERVEVDLARVTFLDSTAINVLVAANKAARARGSAFAVINPTARARRLLTITGLLDVLTEPATGGP